MLANLLGFGPRRWQLVGPVVAVFDGVPLVRGRRQVQEAGVRVRERVTGRTTILRELALAR